MLNKLTYHTNGETYRFIWHPSRTVELIERIADMVHNPELNLTFLDGMLIADGVNGCGMIQEAPAEPPA